jgi:hypothetical protein
MFVLEKPNIATFDFWIFLVWYQHEIIGFSPVG